MMVAGWIVFGIGSLGVVRLWGPLRNHRIDIGIGDPPTSGTSPFAVMNIYDRGNYDERGRKLIFGLYAFSILQLLGGALLIGSV